ncbi:MAG: hypothetical protein J7L07_00190, partial [Candidatus Odinarchaeota archaeon]|nr:hypothetical protein [Candidatus Odinarchaeota archaeon]
MGMITDLLDYFERNKAIAVIFILLSAYFFMGGFKGMQQTLFMKICKEYQWKECAEWQEKCDTCTRYEYKTVTDCEKCGYKLKWKATFYCNDEWGCGGLENFGKIKSASCGSCNSN